MSFAYHFYNPKTCDDNRKGVRDDHLVVFKQFVIPWCEDEGDEDKEKVKCPSNYSRRPHGGVHVVKYITQDFAMTFVIYPAPVRVI